MKTIKAQKSWVGRQFRSFGGLDNGAIYVVVEVHPRAKHQIVARPLGAVADNALFVFTAAMVAENLIEN